MRVVIVLAAMAIAAPAAAQPYLGLMEARDAQRGADAQAARQRDIALTNEIAVMQAKTLTDQALGSLAIRPAPAVPARPANPKAPVRIEMSQMAQIPDAALAASNARAVAASQNRR